MGLSVRWCRRRRGAARRRVRRQGRPAPPPPPWAAEEGVKAALRRSSHGRCRQAGSTFTQASCCRTHTPLSPARAPRAHTRCTHLVHNVGAVDGHLLPAEGVQELVVVLEVLHRVEALRGWRRAQKGAAGGGGGGRRRRRGQGGGSSVRCWGRRGAWAPAGTAAWGVRMHRTRGASACMRPALHAVRFACGPPLIPLGGAHPCRPRAPQTAPARCRARAPQPAAAPGAGTPPRLWRRDDERG
jgi:hypothetical protein